MGIFSFFSGPDINQGILEQQMTKDSILIDVREKDEYLSGHIAGSKNIPLSTLAKSGQMPYKSNTPLFVYCFSGSRSQQAVRILKSLGYTNVKNIGGISGWKGKVER